MLLFGKKLPASRSLGRSLRIFQTEVEICQTAAGAACPLQRILQVIGPAWCRPAGRAPASLMTAVLGEEAS
jgi:hypothetical protein